MKNSEEEIVDNEILKIVNEVKILVKEGKFKNDCFKDLKKIYADKFFKIEEASLNYMGEKDPKILKTEFTDKKWKYLTKTLAYPFEHFNSFVDDYQKPVDNLRKEDFFSKIKNKCPDD